jgi:hypothetical protein
MDYTTHEYKPKPVHPKAEPQEPVSQSYDFHPKGASSGVEQAYHNKIHHNQSTMGSLLTWSEQDIEADQDEVSAPPSYTQEKPKIETCKCPSLSSTYPNI